MGGIQQLLGQNFGIFDPQMRGQVLYPERGQKRTFFDPLPPSSCPSSYWMTPYFNWPGLNIDIEKRFEN